MQLSYECNSWANADSQYAVSESSESNNYLTYAFRCVNPAIDVAQTAAPESNVFASMADISEDTYAKLMNVLGVYVQSMEK